MSLNIYEDQITGLLGHNGAGKVMQILGFTQNNLEILFSLKIISYLRPRQLLCFAVKFSYKVELDSGLNFNSKFKI